MMYDVKITDKAIKEMNKLDRDVKERIVAALERIRIRPESFVKKLVGCPFYRLRVGEYRIILDIRKNELILLVLDVGHRKNIYQRFNAKDI